MSNAPLATRQQRAQSALVIAALPEGLRVHAIADPKRAYLVTGTVESPHCTCPEFQYSDDPDWRCAHILAAESQLPSGNGHADGDHELAERRAIQEENRTRGNGADMNGTGPAQMLVKRSVSPDGRIDSLSVEFSCGVESVPSDEIKAKARRILGLQSEIVEEFLQPPAKPNGAPAASGNGSPAVPARVVAVGGLDGRWGRRLFLNVEVQGRVAKLFGNRRQLGEALTAIGAAAYATNLQEGLALDLRCQAIVRPTDDGRFLNVERLLPLGNGAAHRV